MTVLRFLFVAVLIVPCRVLVAQDDVTESLPDAPPLVMPPRPIEKPWGNLFGALNDQQLLLVGLRLDAAYSGGGAVSQGFSIPSVRLTTWGHAGEIVSYRFSVGQAREFSTVLLPLLLPVQAYVDLNSASAMDWDPSSKLTLRLGLFTPSFNPWWSPDLADMSLALPDYHVTHQTLFISRDMGTEVLFEPIANRLEFHLGVFNGSGIFSLNTNNSRAYTAGMSGNFGMGPVHFTIGASAMFHSQADSTSVNYRADGIWNAYLLLSGSQTDFKLSGEIFGGQLNDSVRTANPLGGASTLHLPLFSGVRLFVRAEALRNAGYGNGLVYNGQIGPILQLQKTLSTFVFYQYLDSGGAIENIGWARVRLVL